MKYLGITGFTRKEEVEEILSALPATTPPTSIMIGVLASQKTLYGGRNKYPNRYPCVTDIASIFCRDKRALNLIHYHTPAKDNDLLAELETLKGFGGPLMHGFQLNIAWPNPLTVEKYVQKYPFQKIVLQVGANAMQLVEHDPDELARRLKAYDGLISSVLLDMSGGRGEILDPAQLGDFLDRLNGFSIAVAGGLCTEHLPVIRPLLEQHPHLSIDAEGKLRDEHDVLDLTETKAYALDGLKLLYP